MPRGQSHGQRGHLNFGAYDWNPMPVLLKSIPYKNKVWKGLSSFPDVKTEAQRRRSFAKALRHFRVKVMCPGD